MHPRYFTVHTKETSYQCSAVQVIAHCMFTGLLTTEELMIIACIYPHLYPIYYLNTCILFWNYRIFIFLWYLFVPVWIACISLYYFNHFCQQQFADTNRYWGFSIFSLLVKHLFIFCLAVSSLPYWFWDKFTWQRVFQLPVYQIVIGWNHPYGLSRYLFSWSAFVNDSETSTVLLILL